MQALIEQLLTNSVYSDEKEARWLTEATEWGKQEDPVKDVAYPYQAEANTAQRNRWLKLDLKFREKLQKTNLPDQVLGRITEFTRNAPKKESGAKTPITGRQILIYLMEFFQMAHKEPRYKLMYQLPQLQWRGDTLPQLNQTMWEFQHLYTMVKEWGGPEAPPLTEEEEAQFRDKMADMVRQSKHTVINRMFIGYEDDCPKDHMDTHGPRATLNFLIEIIEDVKKRETYKERMAQESKAINANIALANPALRAALRKTKKEERAERRRAKSLPPACTATNNHQDPKGKGSRKGGKTGDKGKGEPPKKPTTSTWVDQSQALTQSWTDPNYSAKGHDTPKGKGKGKGKGKKGKEEKGKGKGKGKKGKEGKGKGKGKGKKGKDKGGKGDKGKGKKGDKGSKTDGKGDQKGKTGKEGKGKPTNNAAAAWNTTTDKGKDGKGKKGKDGKGKPKGKDGKGKGNTWTQSSWQDSWQSTRRPSTDTTSTWGSNGTRGTSANIKKQIADLGQPPTNPPTGAAPGQRSLMIQKVRTYWKSVAEILNVSADKCDRSGCAIRHYCRSFVHNGVCNDPKCYRIHANPPTEKRHMVWPPKQQSEQGGYTPGWQRRGGAAQTADTDGNAPPAAAAIIVAEHEDETANNRRDQMLYGRMGATPLHPEEAFNGRA